MSSSPGTVLIPLQQGAAPVFRVLRDPVETLSVHAPGQVVQSMNRVMQAVRGGLRAAGWLAYEAAPAMDYALRTHTTCPVPLLWFGLYRKSDRVSMTELQANAGSFNLGPWQPSIPMQRYMDDFVRIRRALADGESYQVNHTFRLGAAFGGDALGLFLALYRAQPTGLAMYIDSGDFALASASPELFVRRRGPWLTARPMKGTAARGGDAAADAVRARRLRDSVKNRAENIMIVDMIRNDMGRVAVPGSVRARRLFSIESYPTVYQMTSTVTGRTAAEWTDVMRAMFPCASVTGAPKPRTMELIRALETTPRGVYTGSMGVINSPTSFCFNVAIRTVTVDRRKQTAEYGLGGGIVWDSRGEREYRECLAKAAVLDRLRAGL